MTVAVRRWLHAFKLRLALLTTLALLLCDVLPPVSGGSAAGRGHKRFVIHVPVKVKTHHHTHTVYSHIQSGGTKQTVYKVLGYSAHSRGHTKGNGHGHGHGHGDMMYEDETHACDGHGHGTHGHGHGHGHGHTGDMIFNHYSRHDEDYPDDVEDFTDDDDWE